MPSTPNGFPYPAATDPVAEGAAAIQALATAIDPLKPRLVVPADMPSLVPTDGMQIRLLVDAAAGIEWQMVYRAASPNVDKWEFIGGQPLFGTAGDRLVAGAAWVVYPPTVTIPRPGWYRETATCCNISNDTGASKVAHLGVGPFQNGTPDGEAVATCPNLQIAGMAPLTFVRQLSAGAGVSTYILGQGLFFDLRTVEILPLRIS